MDRNANTMENKEEDEYGYLYRAKQFANVEIFRAVLGVIVGVFFLAMLLDPLGESLVPALDESDLAKQKDEKAEAVALFMLTVYFIVDLLISRRLISTLTNPNVTIYAVDLGMWVILQFLLLTFTTSLGAYLVWTDNECLLKRMSVLLLILYSYKLYSFILAYSIAGSQEKKSNDESSESHKKKQLEALQSKV